MKFVIIACAVFAALFVMAAVMACCKVSGDCSRQEEKKNPCASCVRWFECNGVDEDCPFK